MSWMINWIRMGMTDDEDDLFLFFRFDLDFFRLFLLERFTIFGLDEGEFFSLFLDLCRLSCFLVEEVSRFSDTLFVSSSYDLSPALLFFCPALSLELTTGKITFALCWSVCRDSVYFKLFDIIYCIEYISLDSISCSLPVVRARPKEDWWLGSTLVKRVKHGKLSIRLTEVSWNKILKL